MGIGRPAEYSHRAIAPRLSSPYLCPANTNETDMRHMHDTRSMRSAAGRLALRLGLLAALLLPGAARSAGISVGEERNRPRIHLTGRIMAADSTAVSFATLSVEGSAHGCSTDAEGYFRLQLDEGDYTLVASAVGYDPVRRDVRLRSGETARCILTMHPSVTRMDEVVVVASGVGRVRRSAFNAVALDTRELQNTSRSLSDALSQLPGMKLRESGGVGSDMQLMLDGFSGRHVKIFIDGVPQEGAGTAFDLNNLPVQFAERIEVYKGVVPVGFGTDAIGGVINIVTDKHRRDWHLDASYSFGSFNTHKSYVNFGQSLRNGFTYEINAFQNFSDNDYRIDNWVREFEIGDDGTVHKLPVDKNDVRRVRRFNDRFHNEVVIGKAGVVGKPWADRLLVGLSYTRFYKEIQTGVYQETVFGQKHRKGWSVVPSLEYRKQNLLTEGLDLAVTANYNRNITRNIDTAARYYNWYGEYYVTDTRGEQSYQNSESLNTNWNASATLHYRPARAHALTLNHLFSDFRRTSRSYVGTTSALSSFDIPKVTRKNITGLSWRVMPSGRWNATLFGKYYRQYNRGPVSQSSDGVGDWVEMERTVSAWGFGAAGTWHIAEGLQVKLSYERALRLPTTDELFGDEDLEAGRTDLRPEKSDNCNLNLGYTLPLGRHSLSLDGSLIYRDTKDYIKRSLGKQGSTQFGIYENHGHVKTRGYNISVRYSFGRWLSLGGTWNDIDTRDFERQWTGNSQQESLHYRVRLPNIPYRYAGFDATFHWHDLFVRGNTLTLTYDGFWQHAFPLNWENLGSKESKSYVPEQLSHNLALSYTMKQGRYNLSLECRNLTDARLYDNFSLQKAGRAFYVKVRVHFGD